MNKYLSLKFSSIKTPGGYDPGSSIDASTQTDAVNKLISNVLVVLTAVAGIAFALYFLLGGLNWITAGGDKGKIDKAKGMMTNGAIGMIVITVSYAVTWIVSTTIGVKFLEPETLIKSLTFK